MPDDSKEDAGIISIYNDGGELYITREKNKIRTNIDMVSDIFFMLTRYEEFVLAEKKDKYGRFPASESFAYKNIFLHRPIVNEHMELLCSWLESFSPCLRKKDRWGENSFAVCLSHDVDHILKNGSLFAACRHAAAVLIKLKSFKKAFRYMQSYFQSIRDYTKDPYWTFRYLINVEEKYHFVPSFYFMASAVSDPDRRYDVNEPKIRKLIHELEAYGCEIGYHGSFESFNNKCIMDGEKKQLDLIVQKKPFGCRQHYLRFEIPLTWRYQNQAGILYDTTLTFADHEGFRCGICLPFKPYDILEDKVLDIWELPLLIMEGTLQSPMYRNLTPENGLKKIIGLIETVKKHHGVFTILWHNSSFDYNWEGWGFVFEKTVEYLGKSNCIGLTGREIIEYQSLN
jgi:hypothetical protein